LLLPSDERSTAGDPAVERQYRSSDAVSRAAGYCEELKTTFYTHPGTK